MVDFKSQTAKASEDQGAQSDCTSLAFQASHYSPVTTPSASPWNSRTASPYLIQPSTPEQNGRSTDSPEVFSQKEPQTETTFHFSPSSVDKPFDCSPSDGFIFDGNLGPGEIGDKGQGIDEGELGQGQGVGEVGQGQGVGEVGSSNIESSPRSFLPKEGHVDDVFGSLKGFVVVSHEGKRSFKEDTCTGSGTFIPGHRRVASSPSVYSVPGVSNDEVAMDTDAQTTLLQKCRSCSDVSKSGLEQHLLPVPVRPFYFFPRVGVFAVTIARLVQFLAYVTGAVGGGVVLIFLRMRCCFCYPKAPSSLVCDTK